MPNPADFTGSDTDLYLEPVYGLRMWLVRDLRLCQDETDLAELVTFGTGLYGVWGKPWTAGENVAHCINQEEDVYWHPSHTAVENCRCGFYAYWEESPDRASLKLAAQGMWWCGTRPKRKLKLVFGVVKAYGHMTIGSLGFRAEKSEIVALSGSDSNFHITTGEIDLGSLGFSHWEFIRIQQVNDRGEYQPRMADSIPDEFESIPYFSRVQDMVEEFPCAKTV